jgi:hypothetical protein
MANRHDRRKAAKERPRVLEIYAGDHKMIFTPATIDRVCKEFEAENPGKTECDMTSEEFSKRCMEAIYESARLMQKGNA